MNQKRGKWSHSLWVSRQVHTKASFGASPVTSQLRWARLDVTGLAPLPREVVAVKDSGIEPFDTGGDTHRHTHTHRNTNTNTNTPSKSLGCHAVKLFAASFEPWAHKKHSRQRKTKQNHLSPASKESHGRQKETM